MATRVMIVGDHPWAGNAGTIENIPGTTTVEVITVFGTEMVKVNLDRGEDCFAARENLRVLEPLP